MNKYAREVPSRNQLLRDSMLLAEKMKSRPDYTPEQITALLAREAGLKETVLLMNSFHRRTQVLRELAVYLLKTEAGKTTEEVAQRLGYKSIGRVQQINVSIRRTYELQYEKVMYSMTPSLSPPPSESELAERRIQELLCTRLKREFPALARFSSLSIDELTERFDLAALYSTDRRTLRGALEMYFK